jgi:hypothetical protein
LRQNLVILRQNIQAGGRWQGRSSSEQNLRQGVN